MPVDLRVEGADQLTKLAADLKAVGAKELRRDLLRGIQQATKELKDAAKKAALDNLPKRGGLNEFVASAKFATRVRTSGRSPGVSIVASKSGHDLAAMDRGRLRHPVYGNRRLWVTQTITPGWFTDAMRDAAQPVRAELLNVLDDIAGRLARGG